MPVMLTSWHCPPGSISEPETSWSFRKALHQAGRDPWDAPGGGSCQQDSQPKQQPALVADYVFGFGGQEGCGFLVVSPLSTSVEMLQESVILNITLFLEDSLLRA